MLYKKFLKRIFDFTAALIGLVFLFPLFLLIGILIKFEDKGSVFFKQIRVGQNGKLFKIIKFRTMVENAEKLGPKITSHGDRRVTKIGKILRKYKLDEFPQLINVLKGDMSLVGPRPEVPEYVKLYKDNYKVILKVKPGITDYASLEYKNESEVLGEHKETEKMYIQKLLPKKLELAKKYTEELSFSTDLKLIFKTLFNILR